MISVAEGDGSDVIRSPHRLSRGELERLVQLNLAQPWLERRQGELFDLWDLCADLPEQNLICDLLHRFCYVNELSLESSIEFLKRQITLNWGLVPKTTILVASNKSGLSDSSEAILWKMKASFSPADGWETINFVSGLRHGVERATTMPNIVVVDEFCGTGSTACKSIKWIKDEIKKLGVGDVKLYFAAIASMESGVQRISREVEGAFFCQILTKGISDYFVGKELAAAKFMMLRLESVLEKRVNNSVLPSFGFKKSEALYYNHGGNTPNNVFPIFWWKWLKGPAPRRTLLNRIG